MKNSLNLAPALANKIEEKLETLTQNLATMYQQSRTRPQWTRADLSKLQQHVHHYIAQIITLTVNKEKWLNHLQPGEKRDLFKNLSHYIASRTQVVIQNITGQNTPKDDQNLSNKKINFARKFILVWLESLNNLYNQQNSNKEHKRWLRLLAIFKAKKSAEEETRLMNQQIDEPKPQTGPVPALIPRLELPKDDNDEYLLLDSLSELGLGIGATQETIEKAYQEILEEFKAILNPSDDEKTCFENCHKAYVKLKTVEDSALKKLTEIPENDLNFFYQTLETVTDHLINKELNTLENVTNAYDQYVLKNSLNPPSPSSEAEMQKMEVVMAKVEYQFKMGKNPLKNLEKSQQEESPENRNKTPTLAMRPRHSSG